MKLLQEVFASRIWLCGATFEILHPSEGALDWIELCQGATALSEVPDFYLGHSDLVRCSEARNYFIS